jgi:hypothetical protein
MSRADIEAHEAASYVRPLPKRVPGEAKKASEVEDAYLERAEQIAAKLATWVAFDRSSYELAAGGEEL